MSLFSRGFPRIYFSEGKRQNCNKFEDRIIRVRTANPALYFGTDILLCYEISAAQVERGLNSNSNIAFIVIILFTDDVTIYSPSLNSSMLRFHEVPNAFTHFHWFHSTFGLLIFIRGPGMGCRPSSTVHHYNSRRFSEVE